MNTYYCEYISNTAISIANIESQQKDDAPIWEFNFSFDDITLIVKDNLQEKDGIKIHKGLKIIAIFDSHSKKEALERTEEYVETLLNIFSFSTSTYAESSSLVSILIFCDNKVTFDSIYHISTCEHYPISQRKIDAMIFKDVYNPINNNISLESPLMRSLSWMRKSLNEKNVIDRFQSYWIALESLKGSLNRKFRSNHQKKSEWDGIQYIFEEKIKVKNFQVIKKLRNDLFHGNVPVDRVFVNNLKKEIEIIRLATISAIAYLLDIEEVGDKIKKLPPRRFNDDFYAIVKTNINNIKNDRGMIIKNFPYILQRLKKIKYNLKDNKVLASPQMELKIIDEKSYIVKGIEVRGGNDSGLKLGGPIEIINTNIKKL